MHRLPWSSILAVLKGKCVNTKPSTLSVVGLKCV
nr:MAG TPA: hypothetical protein [Bacteriophage sp.]DAO95378.1 MAG TPA: hypothetical protein [Caudoviricetes sp.]